MTTLVGILLSGRGSNFLALHGAMERGDVPARIALVVSNVAEAQGLEKARALRLPTVCIPHRQEPGRVAHEARLLEALRHAEVEWVCLAGYMRVLSESFIAQYPHRILNIHPALLPDFPGLDAAKRQWGAGVKVAGATAHLVDEGVDTGPTLLQGSLIVRGDEGPEGLERRILEEVEHVIYPRAVRLFIDRLRRETDEGKEQ